MSNLGTIWVVISAAEAKDKLVDFIDSGYLAQAVGYAFALDGLIDKMKLSIQQYGGSIPLALYERIVMQVPANLAEQIPNIMAGYSDALNNKVAVGFGLTMEEASFAAKKSKHTGKIELYSAQTHNEPVNKTQTRQLSPGIQLPANLYNPNVPDNTDYIGQKEFKPRPPPQQEMQSENDYIQSVIQQLGGMSPEQMKQQMDQMQQQAQQAQQQQQGDSPRNLLQTLSGQAVPPGKADLKEDSKDDKKSSKDDDKGAQPDDGKDAKELKDKIDEAEKTTSDDKIIASLEGIKNYIPQLMGLAESNPKVFKQTMDMINKLLSVAKENQKVKKTQILLEIQELAKAIDNQAQIRPRSNGIHYPVGTRLGRFKKVMANGKAIWREMSSGQVQDNAGQPISVKEANKQAKG